MADKDFKTIEEQIEILRSRGLTINNEAQARDFLRHNNYYRYFKTALYHLFPRKIPGSLKHHFPRKVPETKDFYEFTRWSEHATST